MIVQNERQKKAVIYARVSTEEQVREGFSIQAQIAELERYAELKNYEIIKQYIDEGASGKSIAGRPQIKRLIKDAQDGHFEIVMVYKIDRLARKLRDALEISDTLELHNVKLLSLKEDFDTSTPHGKTSFQIMCSFAELERNNIVDRVKMGMIQRAKEGKYNGGRVFGYDSKNKELFINEQEASVVKKIFDYAEQEMGWKAITRRLNEMGYRTKQGKHFSTFSVKTIINNPVYIGKIRFNQMENWSEKRRKGKNADYILVDGTHEAIISQEQWDQVHRIIKKRSYKPSRSNTPYILSGLVKCPVCGHGMVPGRSKGAAGKTYRYYNCGQFHNKGKAVCSANGIRADVVEKYVYDEITRIVSEPYVLEQLVTAVNESRKNADEPIIEEKGIVQSQITRVRTQMDNIMNNMMNDPDLTALFKPKLLEQQEHYTQLQDRLEKLDSQLSEADTKPVDYESLNKLISDFQKVLSSADPDEQKALYRLIIKDIQITKEAPRGIGRQVKAINLHFDFTIDSLHHPSSFELLDHVYDYVEPIDNRVFDAINNPEVKYGDLMESLSILPLAMIRFPPIDLHRPINLLHQHQPHKLMGQRHAPKRQPLLRAAEHRIGEPMAPADDKHDMARPIRAEPVDRGSELLRAPQLAAHLQSDDMRIALHLGQHALPLACLHGLHLRLTHRLRRFLVGYLHDLKLHIRGKPLRILRDPLYQILLLQFADGHNLNEHSKHLLSSLPDPGC